MAAMQDDALKALISDLGEGIVIDPELLEGCSVAAHDLDDMDAAQAAEVAAHILTRQDSGRLTNGDGAGGRAAP